MKSVLLAGLLTFTGCTSTPLSELEAARALNVAGQFKAGYGLNVLGKPLTDTAGLRVVFNAGYTKTYQDQADSLAYGLIVVEGDVSYTVQYGDPVAVYFKAVGLQNGNKLQGCMKRLYGPLIRHGPTSFEGKQGIVQAQVNRGVLGSCSVALVQGLDYLLSLPSTTYLERFKKDRARFYTNVEQAKISKLAKTTGIERSKCIMKCLGLVE